MEQVSLDLPGLANEFGALVPDISFLIDREYIMANNTHLSFARNLGRLAAKFYEEPQMADRLVFHPHLFRELLNEMIEIGFKDYTEDLPDLEGEELKKAQYLHVDASLIHLS